jgi:hypothetical protein
MQTTNKTSLQFKQLMLKGTRIIKGIQDIKQSKLLDELLNNIPQKLTGMSEAPEPRVEDIQPAQELLEERLAKHGYMQSKIIHDFWKRKTRPTCFTLVVDDFVVKYTNEHNAEHLISMLKQDYNITIDQEATNYIGLAIEWDFGTKQFHTHMPGYLDKALIRFKHEASKKKQNSLPSPHFPKLWI